MGLEYGPAGLVSMASTIGMAIGSPLAGRFVDRHGLRPVLTVTTVAQAAFWASAWALPFPVLLVAAAVAGLLALPVFSVTRQCLAAMVRSSSGAAGSRSTRCWSRSRTWRGPRSRWRASRRSAAA
ncbi:MFS transporter [Nonomuraea rubra]|uniref:MFS transporter n=1 Tax=Nonomuraea rubra TaxID=46180 RepID=UPI0033C54FA5